MTKNQIIGAHVIDVDDLSTSMGRERYEKESRLDQIRKINLTNHNNDRKDYEPSHLSIGPYYHGSPPLRSMEMMKWAYLNYLLELNHEKNLHDYIEAINGLEKQARSFYEGEIKMNRKSFVEMLLLDACFILMTFNGTYGVVPDFKTPIEGSEITMDDNPEITKDGQKNDQFVIDIDENRQINETNECRAKTDEDDAYQIHDRLRTKIFFRDMLLVENQIPFFVIIKVYEIVTRGRSSLSLLVENIIQSMKYMFDCHLEAIEKCNPSKDIYHLLHLCHMHFKPRPRDEEKCQNHAARPLLVQKFHHLGSNVFEEISNKNLSCDQTLTVRSVTQYHGAKIKLKKREFSSNTPYSLLDIRFVDDTLEIPCLSMDHETFTVLKNLITFEKMNPQSSNYFTSYGLFWSQFITMPDDVALLIEKEIIRHNFHRDNEIVDQFRSLANSVVFDFNGENYLTSMCQIMEALYQIRRPKWREFLDTIKSKVLQWTRDSTL